jgi:hypothetical protein
MILITITLLIDMFDDTKSNLREVQLADHRIAHCNLLAAYSNWRYPHTFIERHILTLDLRARVTREAHIIHQNINISTRVRKLSVDELEHDETGFCQTSVHKNKMIVKLRSITLCSEGTNSACDTHPEDYETRAAYHIAEDRRQ